VSTTEDEPQQGDEDQDQPRAKSGDSKRPGGATRKQTSRDRASREKPGSDRPRSSATRSSASRRDSESKDDTGNDGRGTGGVSATRAARQAGEVLAMLTGRTPEAVTGIERHDDGWRVQLEVVETHKIPETADLMALYDVELDSSGEFTGHRRVRRYSRGQGGEG
jgi:hypothetical protein